MSVITPATVFLLVKLSFQDGAPRGLEEAQFKTTLVAATRSAYGVLGSSALTLNVLWYDDSTGEAALATLVSDLVPVQAALTLTTTCGRRACRIDTLKVAPCLASLACPRHLEGL